ncbi:alpha/beta hydrolase [Mycetocola reblochoni]|uniref:Alpha/beta hydrolase n=2 Tax=Mycetocola reblochoni TaxID=331618 RepID=A0A3L6ZRJ8_9MICO|nr:alpha/beta hydrolase [Mycetocola reblochoni]RLP70550.1 alpha/beta hydrolase [Mycetocola reblochoni]SJN32614.1 probable exported protease [Mycetocola reblochoni REB411]
MTASSRTHRRRLRRVAVLAVATVTALSLSGCVTAFLPENTASPVQPQLSTPYPQDVDEDLAPYYQQQISWTPCDDGSEMLCAEATVPADWSDPGNGSIALALVMHPATGQRLGSLLTNPGGPGASGVDLIRDSLDFAVGEPLQERFDVVGFDPRGVGRSAPVSCLDGPEMDDYLYGIPSATRGSDDWIGEMQTSAKRFARACEQNSSTSLGDITTVAAARDMDVLRAALGDEKLSYLGYSYGTFLGASYAGLYPERAGRLVLDGALDPSASSAEVTTAQAVGFERSLDAYLTDCLASDDCPFTGTVQTARSTVAGLLSDADAEPLPADDGRLLGANTLVTAIIYPLYSADAWPQLSTMFAAVMGGDPTQAFDFADAYNGRSADTGEYTDNSTEAFTAYNCADYPVSTDTAVMAEQAAALATAAPLIGPYMGYGDIGCVDWPIAEHAERTAITAEGAPPILVIGTSNDPATPYAWAEALADQLDSGVLVSYEGEGHTAYNKGSACVNDTVEDYLIDGTVPDSDPHC